MFTVYNCLWYHGLIAVLVLGAGSFIFMKRCDEVAELGREICFVSLDVFAIFILIFKIKEVWAKNKKDKEIGYEK